MSICTDLCVNTDMDPRYYSLEHWASSVDNNLRHWFNAVSFYVLDLSSTSDYFDSEKQSGSKHCRNVFWLVVYTLLWCRLAGVCGHLHVRVEWWVLLHCLLDVACEILSKNLTSHLCTCQCMSRKCARYHVAGMEFTSAVGFTGNTASIPVDPTMCTNSLCCHVTGTRCGPLVRWGHPEGDTRHPLRLTVSVRQAAARSELK